MLLAIAMLGLLAVFDASARINKNETDVADAQGAVRYGIYQMTRVIRMAGAGGLYVTQAVLNHNDRGLPGIAPAGASYDNVGGRDDHGHRRHGLDRPARHRHDRDPGRHPVAPHRLRSADGLQRLHGLPVADRAADHRQPHDRPARQRRCGQPSAVRGDRRVHRDRDRTLGRCSSSSRTANTDLHSACSDPGPGARDPVPAGPLQRRRDHRADGPRRHRRFGAVDFGGTIGPRFNAELPSTTGLGQPALPIAKIRRAGVLDDFVFFITTDPVTDPDRHPPVPRPGDAARQRLRGREARRGRRGHAGGLRHRRDHHRRSPTTP